ncbi:MAG: hypothetical protein GEU98_14915 [Pseudonocardiaceae bacterium]|nr:hypothetical protein [Pseudonocardiaceae bacterium]
MRAVVWHGPGKIDFEEVPDSRVRDEFAAERAEAGEAFGNREPGWIKVALEPAA